MKKTFIILGVLLAIGLIWFFTMKPKVQKDENTGGNPPPKVPVSTPKPKEIGLIVSQEIKPTQEIKDLLTGNINAGSLFSPNPKFIV